MPAANRPRRSSRVKQSPPKEEKDNHKNIPSEEAPLMIPKKTHTKGSGHSDSKSKGSPENMEFDDDGIDDDLNDTDESSDGDDDIKSKPWMQKKPKSKTSQKREQSEDVEVDDLPTEPIIPKRKKRERVSVDTVNPISPKKEDIKRKKREDVKAAKSSGSLIANMAPANLAKRQPAIRDWKTNKDYKAFISNTRNRDREKPSGSNADNVTQGGNMNANSKGNGNNVVTPGDLKRDSKVRPSASANFSATSDGSGQTVNSNNPNIEKIELGNKIQKELNGLIFKVLDTTSTSTAPSSKTKDALALLEDMVGGDDFGREKDKTIGDKSSFQVDWNGTFLPNSNEGDYDFGEFDDRPSVPMFPEDFSSKRKEWPLSWWGIESPSNELLDLHDVPRPRREKERDRERSRSRSRGRHRDRERERDRDRERQRNREKERERSNRNRDRDVERERDRGWRDDRRGVPMGMNGGSQPYRGDGRYNDNRGPPPGDGHFPPYGHPHGRGGGWNEPRMYGANGRGFGPGPGPDRGPYGPGSGDRGPPYGPGSGNAGFGGRGRPSFPRRM